MSCAGGVHVQSGNGTERPACDDIFADLSDGARVACVRAVEGVSVRRHVCDIVCDFPSRVFGYVCVSCRKHFGEKETLSVYIAEKTVAGAIGGLLGSVLCAVTFFLLFDLYAVIPVGYVSFSDSVAVRAVVFVVLGIVGGVLAEIGDLAASRIKRTMNIKDFGNIFPGHGGVLDRLDSIMFTLVMLLRHLRLCICNIPGIYGYKY